MMLRAVMLALGLMTMVAPAGAQEAPAPMQARAAMIAQAEALYESGDDEGALKLLDAALADDLLPAERGPIERLRAFVLTRMERLEDAREAMAFAVASDPAPQPGMLSVLFQLQLFTDRPVEAAQTLVLIAAGGPPFLERLRPAMVGRLHGALADDPARRLDLDLALINADWLQGTAEEGVLDDLIEGVIAKLLAQGRTDEASAMLDRVKRAETLLRMAIDRQYASLWPAIEALLGPGGRTASGAEVARAEAFFEAAPEDMQARLVYASALKNAAREDEALIVAAGAAPDAAALDALDDDDLWIVDLEAKLLAQLGRTDEALLRFETLAKSRFEGRGGLIAQIINWGLLALEVDRPRTALVAADFADTKGDNAASPYGLRFIDMLRTCAHARLGALQVAEAAAAPLLADEKPLNADAKLRGLICLNRMDAAAALILSELADPERRTTMLWKLQPQLIEERDGALDIEYRAALRNLKAQADVQTAFDAAGRDLPKAVRPPR